MLPSGRILRRNRRDILKTKEDSIFQREYSQDDTDAIAEGIPRNEDVSSRPENASGPTAQTPPITPHVSNPLPKPPDLSRHGRIRKPNSRYDPQLYELGK